jgi:hypothetical protein
LPPLAFVTFHLERGQATLPDLRVSVTRVVASTDF